MKPSSSIILKLALVLFVALNVSLIVKLKQTSENIDDQLKVNEMKVEILLYNIIYQEKSEEAVMDGHLQLESESGEISCLAELTSGNPLLFLRYSHLHCDLCVLYNWSRRKL